MVKCAPEHRAIHGSIKKGWKNPLSEQGNKSNSEIHEMTDLQRWVTWEKPKNENFPCSTGGICWNRRVWALWELRNIFPNSWKLWDNKRCLFGDLEQSVTRLLSQETENAEKWRKSIRIWDHRPHPWIMGTSLGNLL